MPEGDYEAIIEAMEVRTLPTSGKEKLAITFRLEMVEKFLKIFGSRKIIQLDLIQRELISFLVHKI